MSSNFPDLSTPVIMGILNITPDSFYDGGSYDNTLDVVKRAAAMIEQGAGIIDIGGSSTRPGAEEVSDIEEWDRISNILQNIRKEFPSTCISVDTFHSSVALKALEFGADMINDISGGTFDPEMDAIIGRHNTPFVVMHIKGRPGNMQDDPKYDDVVAEVKSFFSGRIESLNDKGANNLILDPGFGFGKTLSHNYTLLSQLHDLKDLGHPIMAGISRKSMINKVLGTKPEEALNGTSILNTVALLNGADILRVHDVKEASEAIILIQQLG